MDGTADLLIEQQYPELDMRNARVLALETISDLEPLMLEWNEAVAYVRRGLEEKYRERVGWAKDNTPTISFEYLPLKTDVQDVPEGRLGEMYAKYKEVEAKLISALKGGQTPPFFMAVIIRFTDPRDAVLFRTRWA